MKNITTGIVLVTVSEEKAAKTAAETGTAYTAVPWEYTTYYVVYNPESLSAFDAAKEFLDAQ